MQERQNRNRLQRLDQYRASKTALFWACVGSVILAISLGFSWGGWVTGGTARAMAEQSAAQARQELVAMVCVDRFMAAPDVGVQLTALKGLPSPRAQGQFVHDGGWAVMDVGSSGPNMPVSDSDRRKAAGLCAEQLATQDEPATGGATPINDGATVAQ